MSLEDTSSNPASEPAGGASNGDAPAPVFDQAAFEERLRKIDPQWNISNFDEMGSKMREALSKRGNENLELRNKWSKYEQLDSEVSRDPNLRRHLDEAIQTYYGGSPETAPQSRYPVANAFDPVVQQVSSMQAELVTMKVNNELSEMERKGFPVTQEHRDEVVRRVIQHGWGSARDHYMAAFGEDVIRMREQEAVRATKEAIQRNADSGVVAGGRTAGPVSSGGKKSPTEIARMSDEEFNAYSRSQVTGLRGPFRE